MDFPGIKLKSDEAAVFRLRELYSSMGYRRFKMSKFEEYDLYVRNKDFLVSDNIITFTDTNGKLMALKPDVTLSIIRSTRDGDTASEGSVRKLYYNENVYRVSKGTGAFKEIMQTGLECIGDVDDYNISEVIFLACESLRTVSEDYILDVSHLGIVSAVIDSLGVSHEMRGALVKCMGEKNLHGIRELCAACGVSPEALVKLVSSYGELSRVLPVLHELLPDSGDVASLERIIDSLEARGCAGHVNIDFSVINDMGYYNGFVFKGFVSGVSGGVLSGGQYDRLMEKMHRKESAIGFAVYLDMLEYMDADGDEYDFDTVVLYDSGVKLDAVTCAVSEAKKSGSVSALRALPCKLKYRRVVDLRQGGK